jgi:hypothetical protein
MTARATPDQLNQIGVGIGYDAPQAAFSREPARFGILRQAIDDGAKSLLHMPGALWRTFVNRGENLVQFGRGADRGAKLHRPCFAQVGFQRVARNDTLDRAIQVSTTVDGGN